MRLNLCVSIVVLLAFATPTMATMKIVFLGDSLTEGFGVQPTQAFPALVEQKLLQEGYDVQVINGGISGSTSASSVKRLQWFLKSKPDILFLALGANDGLRGLPVNQLKENLSQTIELAQQNNLTILLAGMLVPPNYGQKYAADFRRIFPELAEQHQIHFLPFLLDKVAAQPKLNLTDGIHPNPKGHQIIATTVHTYLKPLL